MNTLVDALLQNRIQNSVSVLRLFGQHENTDKYITKRRLTPGTLSISSHIGWCLRCINHISFIPNYFEARSRSQIYVLIIEHLNVGQKIMTNTDLSSFKCQWLSSAFITHWGRDKMATISQTTFTNAFSCIKSIVLRFKFHRNVFPVVQLAISQHWFR